MYNIYHLYNLTNRKLDQNNANTNRLSFNIISHIDYEEPTIGQHQQMPKKRNLVCLEAKLQNGNFLIQKVNISKKQNTQRNGCFEKFHKFLYNTLGVECFPNRCPFKLHLKRGLI